MPRPRSRRGKRVYRLTAEGKEHLAELLADVGPDAFDDDGFGARLAFFGQTRSDVRLQILEGRRRRVEEQRDGHEERHVAHANGWTATPASCTSTAWSRWTARSAGSPN